MNLLIDFLTANGRYGAGEYLRRVFFSLIAKIQNNNIENIHLYALYDSKKEISFEDLQENSLKKQIDITFIDLQKISLLHAIEKYQISRFFIACGQRIGEYPEIAKVKCETICVTHDMLFEEWYSNHIYEHWALNDDKWSDLNWIERTIIHPIRLFFGYLKSKAYQKSLAYMSAVGTMLKNNPNSTCITVSEYSKKTMMYNLNIPANKIHVFYSPEKKSLNADFIQNNQLKKIIESKEKFILLLSADRACKNADKAIKAFRKYNKLNPGYVLLVTGKKRECEDGIIYTNYLSDSDFTYAVQNCFALIYPTYFEGFGYPPLEVMKYGKPVLCSYTTSIPEILGNAPIYFSPLYESAIFDALIKLKNSDYSSLSQKSLNQSILVQKRQKEDLDRLVALILNQN